MLTAYLICLVVGGVFVATSLLSGHGEAGGHEHEHEHEIGHVHEIGHELGHAHELGHDASPSLEGSALAGRVAKGEQRHPFVPFTSFRFWTFGSCFFGLTGVALSQLTALGEPLTALASLGIGLAAGTGTAALVHRLRRPVGATGAADQWVGMSGELLLPLEPGALSKVRIVTGGGERDLVVTLAEGPALPKGTRVVILRVDAQGPAVVQPESAIFPEVSP